MIIVIAEIKTQKTTNEIQYMKYFLQDGAAKAAAVQEKAMGKRLLHR